MFKFCSTLFLTLIFYGNVACAHEFQKIYRLFDLLQNEYSENANLKQASFTSNRVLSLYDSRIRLYYSDTKAFLYYNNQLVSQFILPTESTSPLWKNFTIDVFNKSLEKSSSLKESVSKLETTVLEHISQNLDKYSRVENNSIQPTSLEATLKHNTLYVKLSSFVDGQALILQQIIEQYPDIDGVILDLRGNRGGKFGEALKITDLFLDSAIITYSQEKNRPRRYYTSHSGDILCGKPLAVLTNEFTASAAEIVVTALKEQSRAILIGTKTYGKNSIQQMHSIGNKTLYLTSGHFYSPSGKNINNIGIEPEICTALDKQCLHSDSANPEKDIMVALEFIKNHIS